jgi:hypothetical protein
LLCVFALLIALLPLVKATLMARDQPAMPFGSAAGLDDADDVYAAVERAAAQREAAAHDHEVP